MILQQRSIGLILFLIMTAMVNMIRDGLSCADDPDIPVGYNTDKTKV